MKAIVIIAASVLIVSCASENAEEKESKKSDDTEVSSNETIETGSENEEVTEEKTLTNVDVYQGKIFAQFPGITTTKTEVVNEGTDGEAGTTETYYEKDGVLFSVEVIKPKSGSVVSESEKSDYLAYMLNAVYDNENFVGSTFSGTTEEGLIYEQGEYMALNVNDMISERIVYVDGHIITVKVARRDVVVDVAEIESFFSSLEINL